MSDAPAEEPYARSAVPAVQHAGLHQLAVGRGQQRRMHWISEVVWLRHKQELEGTDSDNNRRGEQGACSSVLPLQLPPWCLRVLLCKQSCVHERLSRTRACCMAVVLCPSVCARVGARSAATSRLHIKTCAWLSWRACMVFAACMRARMHACRSHGWFASCCPENGGAGCAAVHAQCSVQSLPLPTVGCVCHSLCYFKAPLAALQWRACPGTCLAF